MWLAPDSRRLSCAHKRVCRHTVLIFDQPGTDLPVPQLRAENVAGSIVVLHSNIRRTGSLAGMRSQPSLTLSVCCNTKRHTYYCSSPLFPPPRLQIPPEECNQPVLHLPFADCFVSSAYHSLNPPASHLPIPPPPPPSPGLQVPPVAGDGYQPVLRGQAGGHSGAVPPRCRGLRPQHGGLRRADAAGEEKPSLPRAR